MALLVGVSAPASAATLVLTNSTLSVSIGPLPGASFGQSPNPISIVTAGGGFTPPAGLLAGVSIPPKAFFTGVAMVSSLTLTASNGTMVVTGLSPGTVVGRMQGQSVIGFLGGILNIVIPLNVVGGPGTRTTVVASGPTVIVVTGKSWFTGTQKITGITTTTPNGAMASTVTLTGFDNRTLGGAGTLSLVSPTRVLTSAAGKLPVPTTLTLRFVPEPSTPLMLGFVFGWLLLVGRRRMRK